MNQTKTGMTSGFSNTQKTNRLSAAFLGSMLLLALQLFTGKANATVIPTSFFDCTQTKTFTSTCVGSGYYANGWVGNAGYWEWHLSTVGYTTISMVFSTTKSAAAGPTSGQVYYNISGTDVAVSGGSFTVSTSCATKTINLPVACEGVSNLIIKVKMLGATANTATNRITSDNVFNGTSTSCSTAPASGGTVSASLNPVCAGTATTLTLTGATGGAGISYKWQSSPNGSTWSDIVPAATGLSYNVPTSVNDTTYYRALATCAAVPLSPTASSSLRLDVNTVAIGAITGYTAPLTIGTTQNLSNATTGGLWLSSNESVATVDGSGVLTGLFGGTATIGYQVTDLTTGCVGTQTLDVNTVWPNTLALYAGATGTNINTISVPGDATTSLSATGFGAATPCGNGGLSGLTLNAAVDTAYDENGPHVGYTVYRTPGNALNMYRIHARARTSGDGPTKAVIAYRYWVGGVTFGWTPAANVVDLTSSSCGTMSNSWDFNTGETAAPNPTVNGMDSLEVAVFPFAPVSNGGTFQLGSLEVYGIVTNNVACTGSPITATDSVLPAVATICDSGYRFLNYNIGSGGIAGVDISYEWDSSNDGLTWTPIPDATGVVYQTDTLHAGMVSDTTYYRVRVLCGGVTLVSTSETSMVVVSPTPADAGTISGGVVSSILPLNHMLIGAPTYSMSSTAGTGGVWSSNDTSVVSIVSNTGVATPHIPGDAVITYRKAIGGCFGSSKKTVISLYDHTKALYVGSNGNSTAFYTSADAAFAGVSADITTANWGSAATCGNGGISGLTNTTTAQNDATNGRVVMSVKAQTTPITATEIRATLRKQPSGTYKAYLGYRAVGSMGAWTTLATPIDVETDDCGYSHNELVYTLPSSLSVDATGYDFAVFGYNGTTTTTLQVNSISVIGSGGSSLNKATGVNGVADAADNIQVYPNPVEHTLNIDATEAVNVAIFSIDGKKLLDKKNVSSIDVSSLVSGMYLIQVSNQNNMLLKTEKFIKK